LLALRRRIQSEVIDFFTDPVADLYSDLKIPHRRGILLYGPPGNGKTSIIRAIAEKLPSVSALLVIEDLDWLICLSLTICVRLVAWNNDAEYRDGRIFWIYRLWTTSMGVEMPSGATEAATHVP
jgi:Cdc6-like AAA superfamily ATPase